MVIQRAALHAGETILRRKNRGIWTSITWAELAGHVRAVGTALLTAGLGSGDTAAVVSETRPEAVYADLAIMGAGAASIMIHPEEGAERIGQILRDRDCRVVFVETDEQLDKILTVRDRCPGLARVIILDMKGLREFSDPQCVSLFAFVAQQGVAADWEASVNGVTHAQPAMVLYAREENSPTLPPRTLTHREVLRRIGEAKSTLPLRPRDERLAVLRMADVAERLWGLYLALHTGCISNYLESPETAVENLQELQPTVLGADAEAWTHLHARTLRAAQTATGVQRLAYGWGLRAGRHGGAAGAVANFLVLHAVRGELGLKKLRLAYVGGSPPGAAVQEWARSLGITIRLIDEAVLSEDQPDDRSQVLKQDSYA